MTAEPEHHEEQEQEVSPLELFFDLVFVFAITQVTTFVAARPTWGSLGSALLLLGALWWAWSAFAWLTNTVGAERGWARVVLLAAMPAMLVVSLAVPHAFGRDGLAFGLAYLVVRALHLALYALGTDDAGVRRSVLRFTPTSLASAALIIAASGFDGVAQALLWIVALAIDYLGAIRVSELRLVPSHFAERYGLFVIIALGESIVAIGAGAQGQPVDGSLVLGGFLAIAIAAALWWAYFDVVALSAGRRLRAAEGDEQLRLARDSYSYLHLMFVAGIAMVAVGIKKTLAHEFDALAIVPSVALGGGVSLYLFGHVALRLRNLGTINHQRIVVAVLALGAIPLAHYANGVAGLGALAVLTCGLVSYEALRFREFRAHVRGGGTAETGPGR